jgi:thiol-disulfide isomerase/thioredoxin
MPTPRSKLAPATRPKRPRPRIAARVAAIGSVLVASAILVGYFVWMVQPAAAHEAVAACNGMKANPKNSALGAIPRRAPEFAASGPTALLDNHDRPLQLKNYLGKIVLVHFWASWCGACEQEKPSLVKMAEDLSGPDFQVVTIASDVAWNRIKRALPNGAPFQVFLDKPDDEGSIGPITQTWGTKAVPESFLIDRKGFIRMYFDNRRDWDSPVTETCIQSFIDE